ncbi:MAG: V-type ATP synthase subunit I [Methanobacterium sp.]
MFRPARMEKLKILTLDVYSNFVVNSLHEEDIVQIDDISERIQQDAEWKQIFKPSKATANTGKISSLLMKTSGIIDLLKSAEKKDKSMLNLIKGLINPKMPEKREVERLNTEALIEKADAFLDEVEGKTLKIEDKLNDLDFEKNELNTTLINAKKLEDFDINLDDLRESKYTSILVGKISADALNTFNKEFSAVTDKILILEKDLDKIDKTVIIVTLKEYSDEIAGILRKLEFERYETQGLSGKPKDIIKNSETRIENIQKEREQYIGELAELAKKWKDDLIVLKEELSIEKDRNEIFSFFVETENTVMLEAWVTSKNLNKALDIINKSSEGYSVVEVSKPTDNDVPVHLENPRFAKPYELLVNMYSPPSYKEIDPTIFVALIFPFFFGYCLTDAGYGIIDAVIGYILFRGLGKSSKLMRSFGLILIGCGVWAFILGMITNGFIADLSTRWFAYKLPTVISSLDAFVNPQNILYLALIIGVLHVNMGLLIGAYSNIKNGEIKEALGTQINWIVLELGILVFAAFYLFGGSFMLGALTGGVLILIGFGLLLYFNGMFGLMDLSGFLGTILSYARLLALCLSTGGIALTVNILASLIYGVVPVIILNVILALLIFILGHTANLAFQSLGAFIHSLRLHYVEFFSQFYEGGAEKFRTFRTKRKYTKLGG